MASRNKNLNTRGALPLSPALSGASRRDRPGTMVTPRLRANLVLRRIPAAAAPARLEALLAERSADARSAA